MLGTDRRRALAGSSAGAVGRALLAATRTEGALRPAVVAGSDPTLAARAVEHRALARGLADHGDPDRRPAALARLAGTRVHVVPLTTPAATGGDLDGALLAPVEQAVGAGDERGDAFGVQLVGR